MYDNVISVYTRQQAIEDGIFLDVTEVAKAHGFNIPVAVTRNLYHNHIDDPSIMGTRSNLDVIFKALKDAILKQTEPDTMMTFNATFGTKVVDVWAVIEGTSPDDPTPCMSLMMPEDY